MDRSSKESLYSHLTQQKTIHEKQENSLYNKWLEDKLFEEISKPIMHSKLILRAVIGQHIFYLYSVNRQMVVKFTKF